jgi:succinate dehydrogenase/fumarate reductase flavoprotein subunit
METSDVVVVGFGAAGIAAAITAHDAGAEVVVLEKMPLDRAGGNSRVSGQVWFSPRDVGQAEVHLRSLAWEYEIPDEIVGAWASETSLNSEWVRARIEEVRGQVVFDPEDPYKGDGSDIVSRSYGDEMRHLGWLDGPKYEFFELDGNDCGTEWNHIGEQHGFSRLWYTLRAAFHRRDIPVRYGVRATELICGPDGDVTGVAAEGPDGEALRYSARRGVVLASGGFANNSEMARNFLRLSFVTPWGSPGNTGDGIRMAQKVGADLAHPYNYMAMAGIRMPPYETGEFVTPQEARFINVGADGRRFGDETVPYRHGKTRVRGMFDLQPSVPMWTIFDEDARLAGPLVQQHESLDGIGWMKRIEGYRWSSDNVAEIERGWIARGETLRELAEQLEIDPVGLEEEVERYNALAQRGEGDALFGRPAATMSPIQRPPFYGYRWAQLLITTLGGVRKDERGRALDPDGRPVPRLYVAGDVASTYTWALEGGMGLADAMAFGRITARSVLEEPAEVEPVVDGAAVA